MLVLSLHERVPWIYYQYIPLEYKERVYMNIVEQLRKHDMLDGVRILSVNKIENAMDDDGDMYVVVGIMQVYLFMDNGTDELLYVGTSGANLVDEPFYTNL